MTPFCHSKAWAPEFGGGDGGVGHASGSATFNLDPITPEGGYTTDSGFSYLSSPCN
jgi:hypothetical protein